MPAYYALPLKTRQIDIWSVKLMLIACVNVAYVIVMQMVQRPVPQMGVRILPLFFKTIVNVEIVLTILYSVLVILNYFSNHRSLQCGAKYFVTGTLELGLQTYQI